MSESISDLFDDHVRVVDDLRGLIPVIGRVADTIVQCIRDGGTVFWMGNGGSAADSQHLAAEFVGRFRRERRAFASVALTTDTSVLTAVGNDYGFETVFERQIEALCKPGDVAIGLSTSGNSENVLRAIAAASGREAHTIGLTGQQGGALSAQADICLNVPSTETARIQEAHILIGHVLCEEIERTLSTSN